MEIHGSTKKKNSKLKLTEFDKHYLDHLSYYLRGYKKKN